MDFNVFLKNAWSEHAQRPEEVAGRLSQGLLLTRNSTDAMALLTLIQHVLGEHLGRFDEAAQLYRRLDEKYRDEGSPDWPASVGRAWSVLSLAQGEPVDLSSLSASDRVRIAAMAGALLAGRGEASRSTDLLTAAEKTAADLDDKDPGVRNLAVAANNTAAGLEQKNGRSGAETELMLMAAQMARRQWARAGGWLETERADYRLALCHLAVGDTGRAMIHARNGLMIVEKNGADPVEVFFLQEAFVKIHEADGDRDSARRALKLMKLNFEKMSADDQAWTRSTLESFTSRIPL